MLLAETDYTEFSKADSLILGIFSAKRFKNRNISGDNAHLFVCGVANIKTEARIYISPAKPFLLVLNLTSQSKEKKRNKIMTKTFE